MSNYPRNFPNLNHPNWSARTPDRRAELDYPYQHEANEPSWWVIISLAIAGFSSIYGAIWLGYWLAEFLSK